MGIFNNIIIQVIFIFPQSIQTWTPINSLRKILKFYMIFFDVFKFYQIIKTYYFKTLIVDFNDHSFLNYQQINNKSISTKHQIMPTSRQFHIINWAISILTISGGILFTIGSVVYLPQYSYVNGNVGAVLFIIGSTFFLICDILGALVEPDFSPMKPWSNIGSLRALMVAIGNFSFIIGSIFFLPVLPAIVGDDIFTVGSIFVCIPQILTCFGLSSANSRFTQKFYVKLYPVRKKIMYSSVFLGIACLMFFVGTILFKNENSQTIGLYIEGVVFFITGSLLFLIVSIVGAYLRHQPHGDQQERVTMLQLHTFRP